MSDLTAWVLLALILIAIAFSSEPDMGGPLAEYCEMVELNQADSTLGRPDYKGVYDEECTGR